MPITTSNSTKENPGRFTAFDRALFAAMGVFLWRSHRHGEGLGIGGIGRADRKTILSGSSVRSRIATHLKRD